MLSNNIFLKEFTFTKMMQGNTGSQEKSLYAWMGKKLPKIVKIQPLAFSALG